jgi:hypothetical protein
MGIAWVNDQRNAECFKAPTRQFRPVCCCGGWQPAATDVGKIDAGFFEYATFFEDARPPAAAFFALPGIFAEILLCID